MRDRLDRLRYDQFALLLGRGLKDAGIRPGEVRIAPGTIRALSERTPLWEAYAGMTEALTGRVNEAMARSILRPGGFSPPEMRDSLSAIWDAEAYRVDRIVRTETQAVINLGREMGYREVQEPSWRYVWDGPKDFRTTKACLWLSRQTQTGVTLDEMDALVRQARARWFPGLGDRPMIPHINCRHGPRKLVMRRAIRKADFRESEHPRDPTGEFTDKPGQGGGPRRPTDEGQAPRPAPRAPTPEHKRPGERVSSLGGRKVLEAVGMDEMRREFPDLVDTQPSENWTAVAARMEPIRRKLGTSFHPTRFPVDGIDDQARVVWEVKTYSKAAKDIKIKSGHSVDRRRKEMVAKHLGYALKTRLILANGSLEIYEMDGFKGTRPANMRRVR